MRDISSHPQTAMLASIQNIRGKSKLPCADIAIKVLSEKSGLSITQVRKEFEFLVEGGTIINRPAVQGNDPFYIVVIFEHRST